MAPLSGPTASASRPGTPPASGLPPAPARPKHGALPARPPRSQQAAPGPSVGAVTPGPKPAGGSRPIQESLPAGARRPSSRRPPPRAAPLCPHCGGPAAMPETAASGPPLGPRRGTRGVLGRRCRQAPSAGKEMAPRSPAPLLTHRRLTPRGTKWRRRQPRTQHNRDAMKPRGGAPGRLANGHWRGAWRRPMAGGGRDARRGVPNGSGGGAGRGARPCCSGRR